MPRPGALAVAVLAPVLAATAVATALSQRSLDDRERSRVRAGAADAVRAIDRRVRAYTETLYGVRGLFAASGEVTPSAYRDYISSLALPERYPGIQVIGVAEYVRGPARERFVERVRANTQGLGYPRFDIRPAGRRERYLVIDYVEPLRGNEAAFGLDFLADPTRRASARRAAATGVPSATAPIRLVQEQGSQRGFLFQLAFRRGGEPRGIVSAAFRMGDLMQGVLGPGAGGYDLEIYDVGLAGEPAREPSVANRLYDLDGRRSDQGRADPERSTSATLVIGGRRWRALYTLDASPLSAIERRVPVAIALGGLLVAALLTWIVRALATKRVVAERAAATKAAFLATMSHELRTPLVGVTGMLDVLERTDLDPEQRRMVGVAQTSADSLLHVIGDMLDLSRIEAGKLALTPRPTSLRRLAEAVVAEYRPPAQGRGLALELDVEPAVADAYVCDPIRLRQILANLLSNAIKFTPAGKVGVSLRVLAEGAGRQRLAVVVADTGIGVSEEDQRRLFQPFEQIGLGAPERGTGLGLSICRQLAGLMGGELTMDSEPGRGTTMRLELWLPVADTAEVEATPAPAPAAPATQAKGRILLVEDHEVARTVLARQLETVGFRVDAVADGQEALARFRDGA